MRAAVDGMGRGAAKDAERLLGVCLRRIRHQRRKSLQVVAGLAGMSKSTLHRIEWGQHEITLVEIVALAHALECPVVRLLESAIHTLTPPARPLAQGDARLANASSVAGVRQDAVVSRGVR